MKHKILSIGVLIALFMAPLRVQAYEADSLVISQVQVSGAAGANDEYIEIFNPTTEIINLSGWSVQYKSSTGTFPLNARKTLPDFDLAPNKYFLIGHIVYSGNIVADLQHSAFTLSGSDTGATIFLSKSSDYLTGVLDSNLVDRLAYGSSLTNVPEVASASLPPNGKSLLRKVESNNNSSDFEVIDSNPRNNAHVAIPHEEKETPVEEEPDPENPIENEDEEEPVTYPSGIKISEIMANPEGVDPGEEWIELYNPTLHTVLLEGWILDDSLTEELSSKFVEINDISLKPEEYKIILIPEGKFTLNNTNEEQVKLYWPNRELVTSVKYAGPVKEEQSWCQYNNDFHWCNATPNKQNQKLEVVKNTTKKQVAKKEVEEEDEEPEDAIDYSKFEVKLIALLPDPDGTDSGNEIVTIFNQGNKTVNLKGWILDDGATGEPIGSSAYVLTTSNLNIGEELEVQIPTGKFAMNNSGSDTVRLFSPDKKIRDSVVYESPEESQVYVKKGEVWSWAGEVLGEDEEIGSESSSLPRTGINIHMFSFASLVGICYIVYGFRIMKGIHEQTRSHRSISS